MKKLLSFTFAILLTSLTIGCTANTQTSNNTEIETPKGTYNIAYISSYFLTEFDKNADEAQMSLNPEYHGDLYKFQSYSSGYISHAVQMNYYCYITDWEYGKNDTIILHLTDGRTLQTSSNNVILMYDPNLK